MMTNPYRGVDVKLQRAEAQIDELERNIKDYFKTEPYHVDRSEDDSTGDLVYTLRIERHAPLELAGIAGDAVHNLRSALDHLVWRTIELSGGIPTRSTRFPIVKDRRSLDDQIDQALDGACDRAKSLVRHLRPAKGSNDLLWKLHQSDIVDKHRLLLAVGAAYKNVVIQMQMNVSWQEDPLVMSPIALNPSDRLFPLKDGEEIFRVKAQARGSSTLKEPKFTFEIAFGAGEAVIGEPMVATLRSIHAYITRIRNLFRRYALQDSKDTNEFRT